MKVGSVVKLKSGGIEMTVVKITEDGDIVVCYTQSSGIGFIGMSGLPSQHREVFPKECLIEVGGNNE
ncbi:MAG: DUF2158 domain-containing protein [Melioribacteraceae bacterium]|nr:DUF2158 domain-containing protein [Melioribacteraceae bacterium]